MSAISALKGYRTQFLYSLHYILTNQGKPYSYRLEGEEDLDVLDENGHILYAIQVKNLGKTLTLSDLLVHNKTSFIKRFVTIYPNSKPILASFGPVSAEIKKWKESPQHKDQKEKENFQKSGIPEPQVAIIKENLEICEVNEDILTEEILEMLKAHQAIDPVPTAENLLYYIQITAEKQQLINAKDILDMVARMGIYLSECIAFTKQFGIYIKPLVKTELTVIETENLKEEFYYGISARYDHISAGLDVQRKQFLNDIAEGLNKHNVAIINGASGQGKSTIAYRYVFNKAASSLIYEVILQDDPLNTNEAILAISALTKGLKVPAYFILHVTPNTTSWLKIAREFANHKYLRLLVTIRKEDWYRAQSAEPDFLYSDIELELAEEEAQIIFENLEQRRVISKHNDFKDAWIELKKGVPLLEFVHAITQGSSLHDKLKSQVTQLEKEEAINPTGQLELLRTVSLSDAFGARVDAALVRNVPNIKLLIDKFEKEYLLKHSSDRRYLTGLHPIRSVLIVEILFDEFIVCKKDYISRCLQTIEQEDFYGFMLQALHAKVLSSAELIGCLKDSRRNTWTIYGAATKSFIWAGVRDYIDLNQQVLNDVFQTAGDGWSIVADIYHGGTLDLEATLSGLPGENENLLNAMRDTRERLSPKSDVYLPLTQFFDQTKLPPLPSNYSDWRELGDALFWLKHTENRAEQITGLGIEDFKKAFEILDTHDLATMMLGMHEYSEEFNSIRLELAALFDEKIQEEYQVPLLQVNDDVNVEFMIDMTQDMEFKNLHNKTMEVIDMLRLAYPDKAKYCSQGHGHRITELPYDDTNKHISARNLPIGQWVNVNATIRQLTDFPRRPDDWNEFHQRLGTWEQKIKKHLHDFQSAMTNFRKTGTFVDLMPVMEQKLYQSLIRLTLPKSAVDPLGIPAKSRKARHGSGQSNDEKKELYLSEKYKPFFDAYNSFKNDIENFIRQSGDTTVSMVKQHSEPEHQINQNIKRLSFTNLYSAAEKRLEFEKQRGLFFKKYIGKTNPVSDQDLFTVASTWKSFWAAIDGKDLKRIALNEVITSLKNSFINALKKGIKAINKNGGYKVTFRNDAATAFKPIFTIQVEDTINSIGAIQDLYEMLFDEISGTKYVSLKYMMLERFFSKFYVINQIKGYVLNVKWFEFPLHLFLDTSVEALPDYRWMPYDIDPKISAALNLKSWLSVHPGMQLMRDIAADFEKMKLYTAHLADLEIFNDNPLMNEIGDEMVKKHFHKSAAELAETWNRFMDSLSDLCSAYPEGVTEMDIDKQDYWKTLVEIMNAINPEKSGNGTVNFNIQFMKDWAAKLNDLSPTWNIFMLMHQRKLIKEYQV
jgi:hypothetical protein